MATTATTSKSKRPQKKKYRRRSVDERLEIYTDRMMLELMRYGRRAINPKTGHPLVDEQGRPIYTTPSAADLAAVVRRLGPKQASNLSAEERRREEAERFRPFPSWSDANA